MLPTLSSVGVVDVLPSFLHRFFPTDPAILNGVYMSEALNPIFVDNFERDPTLTWQYFGSSTGFFRLYPGKRAETGFALSVQHNSFAEQEESNLGSLGASQPQEGQDAVSKIRLHGLMRLKEWDPAGINHSLPLEPAPQAHCPRNPRGVCWQGSPKKLPNTTAGLPAPGSPVGLSGGQSLSEDTGGRCSGQPAWLSTCQL